MFRKLFTNNPHKNILQWLLAAFVAFCVANLLIIPYWRAPGWIARGSGATSAIYHAGTTLINGYEGFGIVNVDEHGYLNPDLPLADSYVLALGCSHTKAIEVAMDERYTSILNDALSGGDDSRLYVYNLAIDGFYYTDIVKGFAAALEEFPDAGTVIIEIPSTDLSLELLTDSLNSRPFDPAQTGAALYETQGAVNKATIAMKEYLPLVSLYLSKQFVDFGWADETPFLYTPSESELEVYSVTKEAYLLALEPTLSYLRETYDKEIIIYYHPPVSINSTSSDTSVMSIDTPITASWFAESCEKYGITFINAENAFQTYFEKDYTVPYGFANTTPGSGHLNKEGHRISAELLLDALTGEDS